MKKSKVIILLSVLSAAILLLLIIIAKVSYKDLSSNTMPPNEVKTTSNSGNITTPPLEGTDDKDIATQGSIEEIMMNLKNEKETIEILNTEKNGDFIEELPRLEKYYTSEAPFEFYIYSAVKDRDEKKCLDILDESSKKTCNDIIKNIDNTDVLEQILLKDINDINEVKNLMNFFNTLQDKNCGLNKDITRYLGCKKMINKDFDVKTYFMKYKILEWSNALIVEKNYEKIIQNWNLDNDFISVFSSLLEQRPSFGDPQ